MDRGSLIGEVLREAYRHGSLFLLLGLIAAYLVRRGARRSQRTRATVRGTALILIAHMLSLVVLAYVRTRGLEGYREVHLVSVALAAMVGINVSVSLLFDGLLRLLRVHSPRILSDVVAFAAYVVATLLLLGSAGVNLSGLIATSAVLTAVIGFSAQDTLGNLMGGLALQVERTLRPGDWIEVEGEVGRVVEIRWRQTTIETRNWESVVIPNRILARNRFTVLGRRGSEPIKLRRHIDFNVDFRTNPSDVIRVCNEVLAASDIRGAAKSPQPSTVLLSMDDSYNHFSVRYWLSELEEDELIDSFVRTRIFLALKRAGIPLTKPAHAVFLTQENEERRRAKADRRHAQRVAALGTIDLFAGLSPVEIDELAEDLVYSPYEAGETLTRQDDDDTDLFLVVSGTIEVRLRVQGDSEERTVAELSPGAFFGERSLLTGEPRSATTVAETDSVCYRLTREAVERLLERRPELAEELAETLAARMDELDAVRARTGDKAAPAERDRGQLLGMIRRFFGLS